MSTNGSDAGGEGRLQGTGGDPAAANHELLGWGLFLTATGAGAMIWAGIDWPIITGCCLLLLVSFVAVWHVQRDTGITAAPAAAPVPVAASAAAPVAAASAPALPSEPADGSGNGTAPASGDPAPAEPPAAITRKQMRAADPTTGLLPVVPVLARAIPLAPGNVRKGLETVVPGGRRERRLGPASAAPSPAGTGSGASAGQAASPVRPAAAAGAVKAMTSTPVIIQAAVFGPAKAAVFGPAPEPAGTEAPVPDDGTVSADGTPAAESRWTRAFGPPETGQLPVQRYVAGPAGNDPADPARPDRRQRSHSSL